MPLPGPPLEFTVFDLHCDVGVDGPEGARVLGPIRKRAWIEDVAAIEDQDDVCIGTVIV